MESQYVEISRWSEWCLENTCSLLQKKFPGSAIWLVRPSRILRNLFSSFHHFVESSITGVPTYSSNRGAILHLNHLLEDVVQHVKKKGDLDLSVHDTLILPVVIIGFSKGCVVLNQITHELVNYYKDPSKVAPTSFEFPRSPRSRSPSPRSSPATTPTGHRSNLSLPLGFADLEILRLFVARIRGLIWLDAGHSGSCGAWVTEDDVLKTLASLKIPLHVHVTPHQVRDPLRVWIGEEEAEFVAKLRQFGADVKETLHFEHDERSLQKHFQVLNVF